MTPDRDPPPDDQSATVALLADPETHDGVSVERVDTHISHLFLAGPLVYKLKRAVRTNFLDFSTAALRRRACERELEVNAVAGALYRRVVPIVRRADGLHLGGDGDAIDWVVEMARFDRATEFDRLADRGELTLPLVERLADAVARMHDAAPPTPPFGGSQAVRATIRQIADAISAAPGAASLVGRTADWRRAAEDACTAQAARLDARQRHGCVRRCHGDLHLGNICLIDGRPTPFDALEFNEEMASTDVLYDIAFTVMDLSARGLHLQANALLARYLSARRDYSGLALMPLFISMRAAVRGLVAASRKDPDTDAPSAAERMEFAISSLAPSGPSRLIAIGGLSGSGKSTIARHLAPDIGPGSGAVVLRSDVVRKRLFDQDPEAPLPAEAYRPEVSERVYTRMRRDAGRALRAGVAVILDAAFLSDAHRRDAEETARRAGVTFDGLWLDCAADELRRRVAARRGDASDAGLAVLERQLALAPSAGAWRAIDAGGDMAATLGAARAGLEQAGAPMRTPAG